MTIEQLYAEERRLEGELEAVREQNREHINHTGSNKIIKSADFHITADIPASCFVTKVLPGVTVLHKPTGVAHHCYRERSQHRNKDIAFAEVKRALLALGWREE